MNKKERKNFKKCLKRHKEKPWSFKGGLMRCQKCKKEFHVDHLKKFKGYCKTCLEEIYAQIRGSKFKAPLEGEIGKKGSVIGPLNSLSWELKTGSQNLDYYLGVLKENFNKIKETVYNRLERRQKFLTIRMSLNKVKIHMEMWRNSPKYNLWVISEELKALKNTAHKEIDDNLRSGFNKLIDKFTSLTVELENGATPEAWDMFKTLHRHYKEIYKQERLRKNV